MNQSLDTQRVFTWNVDLSMMRWLTVGWEGAQRKHFLDTSHFTNGKDKKDWLSVNSPNKGPVTRKMFPFDDVIMVVLRKPRLAFPFLNFYFAEKTYESHEHLFSLSFFHAKDTKQYRI